MSVPPAIGRYALLTTALLPGSDVRIIVKLFMDYYAAINAHADADAKGSISAAPEIAAPLVASYVEGFICYVPDDQAYVDGAKLGLNALGMSDALGNLLQWAYEHNIDMLRFDRDGDPIPDFTLYAW